MHTHIEVEKGCYRNLPAWTNHPASTPLGLLKAAYPNNNVGPCDEHEVTQVTTGGPPSPPDLNGDGRAELVLVATGDPDPTGSGRLEVHALNGVTGYSSWLGNWATISGYGNSSTRYAMGDINADGKPEMVFVAVGPTGSGRLEVHALDGATTFQSWLGNWATAAGYPASTDRFTMGDVNGDRRADLVIVAPGPTGSGRLETHILDGATGYSTWLAHWATAAGYASATDEFTMGDVNGDRRADLVIVAPGPTGSGRLETHALDGATGYSTWLAHWATAAGYGNFSTRYLLAG